MHRQKQNQIYIRHSIFAKKNKLHKVIFTYLGIFKKLIV